jgi:signal transduction histidine kinase
VRCQQHCRPFRGQVLDHGPEAPPRLWIKAGRRLVEEQEFGAADDAKAEIHAPALAAGQGADPGAGVLAQIDHIGIFGVISSVAVAARLAKGFRGAAIVASAAVIVGLVYEFSGRHRPGSPVLLAWLGLIAVYTAVSSARRIREGDAQAERLLIELEQTRAAQVRAAALAERQRLAREMHDVLAHSLSGLVLQLEGARLLAARSAGDPQLSGAIDKAHQLARTGLQEARRAIGMLRNDELPGPESIEALVSEFERDSGIPSGFTMTGEQHELNPGTRLALYRVTQEALTNIRKHAHPARAEVRLGYEPDGVLLTIEDAGDEQRPVGLTAPDSGGYGLTGMRERAELLGGTLSAAPTRDGFRVELRVPA